MTTSLMDPLLILPFLWGAVSCSFNWTSASVSEVTVRHGDNITLYCECKMGDGGMTVWFRNCFNESHPVLVLDREYFYHHLDKTQFIWTKNVSSDSYDLTIINVTFSDEGFYYCGTERKKVEDKEKIDQKTWFNYSNIIRKISIRAVSCSFNWTSASVSEVTVRHGDNITLYCDCKMGDGGMTVWFRNCFNESHPVLVLDREYFFHHLDKTQFIWTKNVSSDSYDLTIINVTFSDEGFYYCGTERKKVEDKEKIDQKTWFNYSNIIRKISIRAVSCSFNWTSASVSEVTVRHGDNITLYCDCKMGDGGMTVWFRNCFNESHPVLVLDREYFFHHLDKTQFIWTKNVSSDSYDLTIINVTFSDEGFYYCGTERKKVEDKEKIDQKTWFNYSNIIRKISIRAVSCSFNWTSASVSEVSTTVELKERRWKTRKKLIKRRGLITATSSEKSPSGKNPEEVKRHLLATGNDMFYLEHHCSK
ncbi:uncharacterized protein LOC105358627 isoform X2 [Oryzias latipes]